MLKTCQYLHVNSSYLKNLRVDKSTFSERLSQLIRHLRTTVNAFAKSLNVNHTNVSSYINEDREPGYTFIAKLVKKYPEVNPAWILNGDGEMLRASQEEKDTLRGHELELLRTKVRLLEEQVELYKKLAKTDNPEIKAILDLQNRLLEAVEKIKKGPGKPSEKVTN